MSKKSTLDQVATAKKRAVTFVRSVLKDDDRADEIEEESLQDYADRKGIQIIENPSSHTKGKTMAATYTKKELEDIVGQVCALTEDALTPRTTRTEAIDALQSIYDLVSPDEEEDELDDDDDDTED